MHRLKITCPIGEVSTGNNVKISLDGVPLEGATFLEFKVSAGELVRATIGLNFSSVDIDIPGLTVREEMEEQIIYDECGFQLGVLKR